jgi:hypothetical protein
VLTASANPMLRSINVTIQGWVALEIPHVGDVDNVTRIRLAKDIALRVVTVIQLIPVTLIWIV